MKLMISLTFAILAAAFVFLTFRGGYLSRSEPKIELKGLFSAEEIVSRILSFDLRNYEGSKLRLDKLEVSASKKVVIHLWASWCGPCVGEVPELIEFAKNNRDVVFVIVSLDDYQDDIEKFMKSFPEFNSDRFIRVWDRDKLISKYLNADRLPMSVIINGENSAPQLLKAVVDWKRIKI